MRLLAVGFTLAVFSVVAVAQAPSSRPAAATRASRPVGTLAQVMRGIYFPNANLIFDVQQNDPGVAKKTSGDSAGSASEKYGNSYTGWEAVENAAVALTDGVDLILRPGRSCQNGRPVPVQRADFQKFARDMRQAGIAALQAARTKSQEKVSDATNNIADACSNCHEVHRDKGPADSPARCSPPSK